MDYKAPDAFRTISEVAEDLDLPQHVLRFWETRFSQIKPLKRGGGRRYYRPDDIDLLKGIRQLLYGEGYTIKGVQRILKEQGPRGVIDVGRGSATSTVLGASPDANGFAEHDPQMRAQDLFSGDDLNTEGDDLSYLQEMPQSIQVPPMPHRVEPVLASSMHITKATARQFGGGQEPFSLADQRAQSPSPLPQMDPSPAANQPLIAQPIAVPPHGTRAVPSAASRIAPTIRTIALGDDGEALPAGILPDDRPHRPVRFVERMLGHDTAKSGLSRDDVRRLQATLFELLECKRVLDQAR